MALANLKRLFFSNSSTSQTIAKNTAWLFIGEIVGRLIRFWIVVYAARVLGAAEYGIFSYVLTLAAFATIFADIGLSALLTRETSKAPELRQSYFNSMLTAKAGLILVVGLGIYLITPLITNLTGAMALLPLVILMFIFDSLREFGFGMQRGLERMELEAITKIIMNALITGLGFAALWYQQSAGSLVTGYVLGAGIGCLITAWLLRRFIARLKDGVNLKLIWPIFKMAWPLGVLQLLGAIMINTDMLILGWFRSPVELGYYGAAQKIILLLYVAPNLLASAVFPVFSRLARVNNERFRLLFEKVVACSEILAIPLAVGSIVLAPQIIRLLFGAEYLPGTATLALLMTTLVIVFPSTIFSNALFAFNQQKKFMLYVAIGVVSNIILDIIFIPRWGIEGSAWATIISQVLTNIFIWRAMYKTNPYNILKRILRPLTAAILMGALIYGLAVLGLPLLLIIALGAASYLALLYLLREPLLAEARTLFRG